MNPGDASLWLLLAVLVVTAAGADDPAKKTAGRAEPVLRGRVLDARDGKPIARFRLVPASVNSEGETGMWQPHLLAKYEAGQYEFRRPRGWQRTRYRVDAVGYRPAVSRLVKDTEGDVTIDFALQRDPGIPGVVRTAEGVPVAGARVMWATDTNEARVSGGRLTLSGLGASLGAAVVETGPDGSFRLPAEVDPGTIVAAHERHGYAEVAPEVFAGTGDVTLRPWGRVEGRVLAGDSPVAGRLVTLGSTREHASHRYAIYHSDEATTDAAGQFAFERVPAGRAHVNRAEKTKDGWISLSGTAAWIEIVERGTTRITLGGPGCAVVGRLKLPQGVERPVHWSKLSLRLFLNAPHIGLPGDDEFWRVYGRFASSAEGRPYFREKQPIGADGTFRLEGVPQGHYTLQVWTAADPEKSREAECATACSLDVPATPDGRGDPIDLGALPVRNADVLPE